MKIEKFNVYLADLNPRMGTEPGKVRPVTVVQTNLLNGRHPSTVICPITSSIVKESKILRIHLSKNESGLSYDSDVLVDRVRAIDNRRFIKHLGKLSPSHQDKLRENLRILLIE